MSELYCIKCRQPLKIEPGKTEVFCLNCGQKNLVPDDYSATDITSHNSSSPNPSTSASQKQSVSSTSNYNNINYQRFNTPPQNGSRLKKAMPFFILLLIIWAVVTVISIRGAKDSASDADVKEAISDALTVDSNDINIPETEYEIASDVVESVVEAETEEYIPGEIEAQLGSTGYNNFLVVAQEIGLDPDKVKHLQKIDDWASGERFSFVYKGQGFVLYMLESGYVDGIDTEGYQVYKDGLEPYQIDEFVVGTGVVSQLRTVSEAAVKSVLNYPDTANFDWITTGEYAHVRDYYFLTANVKAKNAFGVQSTVTFTTEYHITGSNAKLIYFVFDGATVSGSYVDPLGDRKEAPSKIVVSSTSENSFILKEDQIGEYGKMQDDGIILFYVPAGKYKVTAINKGMAFVSLPHDDEYCDTYTFDAAGDCQEITVPEGNVVQLMINTVLEFEPIE